MEKEQMVVQAKEKLTPFETGNIVDFIQHLDMKSAMEHPLLIVLLLILVFLAVVRRSKVVLLFLFASVSIVLLVRYTLTPEAMGAGMTVGSMVPFVAGGLLIGGVLIYFGFIKHD
jgi:hypothetical protein